MQITIEKEHLEEWLKTANEFVDKIHELSHDISKQSNYIYLLKIIIKNFKFYLQKALDEKAADVEKT